MYNLNNPSGYIMKYVKYTILIAMEWQNSVDLE